MAKKKVKVKSKPEEKPKEVLKKKSTKKAKTEKKEKPVKKSTRKTTKKTVKKETETISDEIDELSIDEVADELSAFDEETPSELEREVIASEKEFDEEIQEERIYMVPLAKKYMSAPNWKRTKKSVKVLREFLNQHMKPEALYISPEVNERLWENGIKNPPRKLRVRVTKSVEGLVRVFLA